MHPFLVALPAFGLGLLLGAALAWLHIGRLRDFALSQRQEGWDAGFQAGTRCRMESPVHRVPTLRLVSN